MCILLVLFVFDSTMRNENSYTRLKGTPKMSEDNNKSILNKNI